MLALAGAMKSQHVGMRLGRIAQRKQGPLPSSPPYVLALCRSPKKPFWSVRRPRKTLPQFPKSGRIWNIETLRPLCLVQHAQEKGQWSPGTGPFWEQSQMLSSPVRSQQTPLEQNHQGTGTCSLSYSGCFELALSPLFLSQEAFHPHTLQNFCSLSSFFFCVFFFFWDPFLFKSFKASLRMLRDTKTLLSD